MPILTIPVAVDGPVITVWVSVSGPRFTALRNAGKPVPNPVQARLLIDTGAWCTVIDKPIIAALGLTPSGTALCHTPSTGTTPAVLNQFDVSLVLGLHVLRLTLPVVETDFSAQSIDGLLGRDVLSQCLFVYNGTNGQVAISV